MYDETWRIVVDRGDGKETIIHEGDDINKVYVRIGQMALSMDIQEILVYRNGKPYRLYIRIEPGPLLSKILATKTGRSTLEHGEI